MTEQEKDLLNRMNAAFSAAMKKDTKITAFMRKLDKGQADYSDAWDYADRIGEIASKTAQEFAGEIQGIEDGYEAVKEYLINNGYNYAADYTQAAQDLLNQAAGVGLKAQKADVNMSKVSGIAHNASNAETVEEAKNALGEPVKNFTGSVVGDTLKKNVEFQHSAGLRPKVKRISTGKCCEWCDRLAGTYNASEAPREIYQRHERCRCTVIYDGTKLKAYRNKAGKENTFREEDPSEKQSSIIKARYKNNEGVFETYDFRSKGTNNDIIKPRNIYKELNKSQYGKHALEVISEKNIKVKILYDVDNPNNYAGLFDNNDIIVFADKTKTVKETALTVIHEAKHAELGGFNSAEQERECYLAEYKHEGKEITKEIIEKIDKMIYDMYDF